MAIKINKRGAYPSSIKEPVCVNQEHEPVVLFGRRSLHANRSGFALVVSLGLMAFVLLLLLTITSLVRVESEVAGIEIKRLEARQNALLGLQQAIGVLQEEMGPDQRISANADLLNNSADGENDAALPVEHPYLVGVWDSSGDRANEEVGDRIASLWDIGSGAIDYNDATTRGFRRWLISSEPNGAEDPEDLALAADGGFRNSSSEKAVRLLGGGTLQPDDPDSLSAELEKKEIWAPTVNIHADGAAITGGKFAWAVLDESTKARANLTSPVPLGPPQNWRALNFWSSPGSVGIDSMGQAGEFQSFSRVSEDNAKATGFEQLSLHENEALNRNLLGAYYHDLSFYARSVQSNVVDGGLKRDLSTLAVERPTDYTGRRLFSDTNAGHPINPAGDPYWTAIFDYVNIYKDTSRLRIGSSGLPEGQMTTSDWGGVPNAPGSATRAAINRPLQAPREHRIAPAIVKVEFFLSVFTLFPHDVVNRFTSRFNESVTGPQNSASFFAHNPSGAFFPSTLQDSATVEDNEPQQLYLVVVPSITLHNPYNMPLDVSQMWVVLRDPPVGVRFSRIGEDGAVVPLTTEFVALSQLVQWNYANENSGDVEQLRFAMRLDDALLQPGETKVFAPEASGGTVQQYINDQGKKQFDLVLAEGVVPDEGLIWDQFSPPNLRNRDEYVQVRGYELDPTTGISTEVNRLMRADQDVHGIGLNTFSRLKVEVSLVDGTQNPVGWSSGATTIDPDGPYNGTFSAEMYGSDPRIREAGQEDSDAANLIGRYVFDYVPGNPESRDGTDDSNIGDRNDLLRESQSIRGEDYEQGLVAREEISHGQLMKNDLTATKFNTNVNEIFPQAIATLRFSAKVAEDDGESAYHPGMAYLHTNPASMSGHYNVGEEPPSMKAYDLSIKVPAGNLFPGLGTAGSHHTQHENGISFATQYELPLSPLHSIASLQHADIFGGSMPRVRYAAGNSFAHPLIPADAASVASPNSPSVNYGFFDPVYLTNVRLWDRYYFSSIADQASLFDTSGASFDTVFDDWSTGIDEAPNPSFVFYLPEGQDQGAARVDLVQGNTPAEGAYRKMAAYQLLEGGFNVNSTSIEAWKALLASNDPNLTSLLVPTFESTFSLEDAADPAAGAVFSRYRIPNKAQPIEAATGGDEIYWQSYRRLTDEEVSDLAEEIVNQVRIRGPFLSLADFVNRRLSLSPESRMGALDKAIDLAEINQSVETEIGETLIDPARTSMFEGPGSDLILNGDFVEEGDSTAKGIPTFLTQADILQSIGPRLTVRSDTFTIRAYGDVRDLSGNVVARSVCEAVIQRVPDYVDASQDPFFDSNPVSVAPDGLSDLNERFGRKFRVVGFRWLDTNEI
jgi:hypothetical protein